MKINPIAMFFPILNTRKFPPAVVLIFLIIGALACSLTTKTDNPAATSEPTSQPTSDTSQQPMIVISDPLADGGTPPRVNAASFTVAGQERGSFESNVIVQALDADGKVLHETFTTATGGEPGDILDWQVTLQPNAVPGTTGSVYAFFTSPRDGSVVAEAQLEVFYGE